MWVQIIMAAVNILEGGNKSRMQRKLAAAQEELDQGRADRADDLRKTGNEMEAANANLERVQQSYQNQRVGRAVTRQMDAESINVSNMIDGLASQKFEGRLQSMANIGTMAAQAAASGVGGASVELAEKQEQMHQQRVDAVVEKQIAGAKTAEAYSKMGMVDSLVAQTDTHAIFAQLDTTAKDSVFKASKYMKYSIGQAGMDGMNGFMGNMNNVGMDMSGYVKNQNDKGSGGSGLGGMFGTGKNNKGTGGKGGMGALQLK